MTATLIAHTQKKDSLSTAFSPCENLAVKNNQLQRDGLKLIAIIECLQADIRVISESNDSCTSYVQEYQALVQKLLTIQERSQAISDSKDIVEEHLGMEILALEKKAKKLHRKMILQGILIPTGTAAIASGLTILFMSLRK